MNTGIASPAETASSTQADRTYRKVSRRLIPLLFVCYIAAYLDRINIGFAKLQMQTALQFSDAVYGLGAGVFFIGYFLLEVPSNLLLHRLGARKWIGRIMISWGLLSAAMMVVSSPLSFYVVRFLLGAAEAGFFPGIILYLTYWFPASRRGRAMSLFMAAVAFAGILGGPLSGLILKTLNGVQGLAGWQWLFLLEGLPSVALGVCVLMWLDDRIDTARWLDADERRLIAHDIATDEAGRTAGSASAVFTNARVWLLAFVYFCFVSGLYGVSFWLPTIVKAFGVADPLDIGLLTAIPWSFGVVAMYLAARSADRSGERRWHSAVAGVVGAVGLVVSVAFRADPTLSMAGLIVGTMGILAAIPVFWGLPTEFLGGSGAAAGIALINSFGNLSGFAAPYLIGLIVEATHSTDAGLNLLAGMLMLGAVCVLAVRVAPRRIGGPAGRMKAG